MKNQIGVVRVGSNNEAKRLKLPSSPTVRINVEGVEPEAPYSVFGPTCCSYEVDWELLERPPKEWLDHALDDAASRVMTLHPLWHPWERT